MSETAAKIIDQSLPAGLGDEAMLEPAEVAKMIRVSQATLNYWRVRKIELTYTKVGRKVVYPIAVIREYLTRGTTVIQPPTN